MAFHRAMGYDSALGFTGMNVPRTRSVFSWGDGQKSTPVPGKMSMCWANSGSCRL
ncbi:MAG: hypothetical protein JRI53_06740 [Deltaproteobacteria bacterium]|nr:hypothetical protein [Deltaproteobacteria bacterium]